MAVEDASCKEAKRADHITRRRRAQRLPEGGGLAGVRGPGQRRRQKQEKRKGKFLGKDERRRRMRKDRGLSEGHFLPTF